MTSLDAICDAFSNTNLTEQNVTALLQSGNCSQARVVLDAAELRAGSWLAAPVNPARVHLAICHLLVLLCEDDVDSARLLTKRLGSTESGSIAPLAKCEEIYRRLWAGDYMAATELANQTLKDGTMKDLPLAQKALEHFCARLQTRQLHLLQRAYSAISVESFGRAMGLGSVKDVEAFCQWSPNLFEVRDGYVFPSLVRPQDTEDVAAHIERLTRLIVFLESEAVTHISGKLPVMASASSNSQQ